MQRIKQFCCDHSWFNAWLFLAPARTYNEQSISEDWQLQYIYRGHELYLGLWYYNRNLQTNRILVFFHGNASNAPDHCPLLETMSNIWHCHIFAAEYPGYGPVPGPKNETMLKRSSWMIYHYLRTTYPQAEYLVCGHSLGTAIAAWLACQMDCCLALVLVSPFTSIKAILCDHISIFANLFCERFETLSIIDQVDAPVFLVHGNQDLLISSDHSVVLAERLRQLRKVVRLLFFPGSHNVSDQGWHRWILEPLRDFLRNPKSLELC